MAKDKKTIWYKDYTGKWVSWSGRATQKNLANVKQHFALNGQADIFTTKPV